MEFVCPFYIAGLAKRTACDVSSLNPSAYHRVVSVVLQTLGLAQQRRSPLRLQTFQRPHQRPWSR
eukprot:589209-Lingulodinium_polyedra.AAC.1